MHEVSALEVIALQGIPEIAAGDDLAALLLASAGTLQDGDILVVSSKVVSKAAGLTAPLAERDSVVKAQTVRVVAERRTPRGLAQVVESVAGPVQAAAGVDASNTSAATVLVLPPDPDGAARELRARLRALGAARIGVVITDTAGRAWRTGQTDFALGCAGLVVIEDLRGTPDASGTVLEVTERAIADEVAAAADLVKGKASGVPAAIVRGLAAFVTEDDGPGAAALLRDPASDWFRLGHVEAVRRSLGLAPCLVEAPSTQPETLLHRTQRAATVAGMLGSDGPKLFSIQVVGTIRDMCMVNITASEAYLVGFITARFLTAMWSENLEIAGSMNADFEALISTMMVKSAELPTR